MLICPNCRTRLEASPFRCGHCGFAPVMHNGFLAWAPELEAHYAGFRPEYFSGLAALESGNFWFRARNRLIIWALSRYFPNFNSLLEVGCGTGFVLSGIAAYFPRARLVGSEIFSQGLSFAAQRLPGMELVQADARSLPFEAEFDVVTAFDVLEHILEDQQVLDNLYRATCLGGGCLITVPQHRWLWSPADEEACHERRYIADDLHQKIRGAGFRILTSTSFVTLLLPLMWLSRLRGRKTGRSNASGELQPASAINSILETIMDLERICILAGARFPLGGSRLVIARKD